MSQVDIVVDLINKQDIVVDSSEISKTGAQPQVGKSACIVLAKERHSKGERVPFSALS